MKKFFCIFVVLLFFAIGLAPVYGQAPHLEGSWILEKTELFKKENNTYKPVDHSDQIISPNNLPFNKLTFDSEQCEGQISDSEKIYGPFRFENQELELFLRALPETFELEWRNSGQMVLSKTFSSVDNSLQIFDYKIALTYQKR